MSAPLWIPLTVGLMRFGLGWQIEGSEAVRSLYREMRRGHGGPLLVCANHLTLIDSALVAWALASPWWYLAHHSALPWNVPETQNFTASLPSRILISLMKCVPITRGSERQEVASVLARLGYLLSRGEAVLIFPEGGRSRSGRVELESAAYGVGRLVAALPGCRVLCVYLRGERQATFSDLPARGERFHVLVDVLEPTSELQGLRASLDLAQQIVRRLVDLERRHFDGRQ